MSTVSQSIPVERLWELYEYNPLTGQLWSKKMSRYMPGIKRRDMMHVVVRWNGKTTGTNYGRVVYAWCTGAWPINQIDHINHNWSDNRLCNLRDVNNRTNIQNRKDFNGCWQRSNGTWTSVIQISPGKKKYLGTFSSRAEAEQAYQSALIGL
jgi:hypothetical protein